MRWQPTIASVMNTPGKYDRYHLERRAARKICLVALNQSGESHGTTDAAPSQQGQTRDCGGQPGPLQLQSHRAIVPTKKTNNINILHFWQRTPLSITSHYTKQLLPSHSPSCAIVLRPLPAKYRLEPPPTSAPCNPPDAATRRRRVRAAPWPPSLPTPTAAAASCWPSACAATPSRWGPSTPAAAPRCAHCWVTADPTCSRASCPGAGCSAGAVAPALGIGLVAAGGGGGGGGGGGPREPLS